MTGYRVVKTKGTADYEYILIAPNGEELNGGDGLHNQMALEIQAHLIQREVAKRDEAWNVTVDLKDKRILDRDETIAIQAQEIAALRLFIREFAAEIGGDAFDKVLAWEKAQNWDNKEGE